MKGLRSILTEDTYMIQELHISNLAVIEDTTLEFPSRYVSLIGETGAGKSLIVSSLGLLKGEKADFSMVRDPKKKAVIVASFSIDDLFKKNHPEIQEYVDDSDTIILKRTLNPDRTSKTYLNDEPVSLNLFKIVTGHLIDIHSQGENWELFDEKRHLSYLDRFCRNSIEKAKKEFLEAYQELQKRKEKLDEFEKMKENIDPEYLSFQIKEIEKAELKENEIEDLNAEYESLRNEEKIQESFNHYKENVLLPEGNITEILYRIKNSLNRFENTPLDEGAKNLISLIDSTNEGFVDFEDGFHKLHLDPKRMDYINSRLFQLKGLQRKFGHTTKEIFDKLDFFKKQLETIEHFEEDKEALILDISKKEKIAKDKAIILSDIRKKNAKTLEKAISDEMVGLGLNKDGFRVCFEPCELNRDGIDKISFEVRMNQGLEFAPLKKAASGGEASRLMLSLKVVLNALDPYDLLVFDEIDTGVSGRIASLIASKIKKVSKSSQVLVISHLAQVVSSSLDAIKISKSLKGNVTTTKAEVLNESGFELEVARILSGSIITDAALKQAKELIEESRG